MDWEPSTTAGPRLQTLSYKYSDIPDLFAFECVFVNGLKGASVADVFNQTLSTYPSLIIEKADMERGWLTWAGNSEPLIIIYMYFVDISFFDVALTNLCLCSYFDAVRFVFLG